MAQLLAPEVALILPSGSVQAFNKTNSYVFYILSMFYFLLAIDKGSSNVRSDDRCCPGDRNVMVMSHNGISQ